MLIGFSGLAVGQKISIQGLDNQRSEKFWAQSMFSDVDILQTKFENEKSSDTIRLTMRPKVSDITFNGLKKSEIDDITPKIGIQKEKQITPNMSDRAKLEIKRYLDEKGFANADIQVYQKTILKNPIAKNVALNKFVLCG